MQYGVGIIGFGFIGKVHAYCHLNMPIFYNPPPLKAKLIAVCSSRQTTALAAKEQFNFELATTNYQQILERDDIQIVHCCTPNYLHKDFLIDAMKAGKHIYCDKPLAMSYSEAEEILQASETYDKKFQMTFQYQFFPASMRAKQLIDEGFLGDVYSFRAAYLHAGYIDPNRPITWRLDKSKAGGGALFDLGSHIIDLIYHLLGEFQSVYSLSETFIKERPFKDSTHRAEVNVDDITLMIVRLKNGAIGTIETSRLATGTNDELRFEIHGQKGAIRFNLMEPNWLEVYDMRDVDSPIGGNRGFKKIETVQRYPEPGGFPGPKFSIGWMRGHVACLHHFLTCIAQDNSPTPGLYEAIMLQKIMDRVQKSNEIAGWVTI